jgi:alpha-galactosidase
MSHTHQQRDVVIAILGGAGRYWCPVVLKDLALCDRLRGEIRLFDQRDPVENADWGKRLFKHPEAKTSFRVSRTTSLRAALKGADFVVIGISPGPARMFANDLDIPLRYGILQAVGDTTGPGGISRALRTVPIITQFAQGVAEYCPNAWVINYTNPMTLATASLYAAFPGIKAFGCCHEVAAARKHLAEIVRESLVDQHVSGEAIHMDIAGVNHFTFATAASVNGTDLFPLVSRYANAKGRFADQSAYASDNAARGAFWDHRSLIALDLFRRFGALGAAGDRHLAEFVPWYLAGGEPGLHRWGVVVTPSSVRLGTWKPAPGVVPAPNPLVPLLDIPKRLTPSGEEGVQQMCALAGAGDLVTNVNLPNAGQLPGLPFGAVVETNAVFQANAVRPVTPTPLPAPRHSLVHRMAQVHSLTLQAGRTCDIDVALQALLLDPLCRLATDQAASMLHEMLNANSDLLPGWRLGKSRMPARKTDNHPATKASAGPRMTL